jgi:nucleoside-diphosphate-sugar epimerase
LSANVLVTGGAGFIGSHLVDRLLRDGHRVTVLDDLSTGSEQNLADARPNPNFRFVRGGILDERLVDELVAENPLVFHLAAAVGVHTIVEDPLQSILTNVNGTEHVLSSAAHHGSRVLLASTSEVYGRSEEIPFREDGDRILGPTSVHRWSYATAKALDEHLAFAYLDRGLRVSIVRYFNSYGPRIHESGYGSVIARFAAQSLAGVPLTVHGDGKQTRCFTFVSDTVEGTVQCGMQEAALGKVFNIGTTHEVSILELAESIRTITRSNSPIQLTPYEASYPRGFEDTRRRVPDISRARDILGFEPRVSLQEGMERTIAWCRQHYRLAGGRT